MGTALPFGERWKNGVLLFLRLRLFVLRFFFVAVYLAPSRLEDDLSRGFEFYVFHLSHDGCRGKLALGIESCDEASCDEVVDVSLHVGESHSWHACRYDGMVVGHLGCVESFRRLR